MNKIGYLMISTFCFYIASSFVKNIDANIEVKYSVTSNIKKKMEENESKTDSLLEGESKEFKNQMMKMMDIIIKNTKEETFAILNISKYNSEFKSEEVLSENSLSLNLNLINLQNLGVFYANKSTNQVIRSKEYEGINVRITSDFDKYTWVKSDSIQTILGYKCYYATTKSKNGHLVKAWYTKELEGSAGPEDYTGLEGVILELNINDEAYKYKAVEVKENKNYKFKTPKKGKLFTEEEFAEFVKKK